MEKYHALELKKPTIKMYGFYDSQLIIFIFRFEYKMYA